MTNFNKKVKRIFDIFFSSIGLILTGWFIIILVIIIYFETKENGFFTQKRFGQYGKPFIIYKIKTMRTASGINDAERITKIGSFLRKSKLDELPQFWNILKGDMSFVGPRPDYMSFLNELKEEDKIILTIKPGLTGPASIIFMNEEELLAKQQNPEKYNLQVIWPQKVAINKKYIEDYSFFLDIKYLLKTIFTL